MALTADEERQIAMEMAVSRFFKEHFEEISFASRPSDRFHRFYILRAVLEDLSSAGYQLNRIGDFILDLGTSVVVKDARELSARAGRRLVEYIFGEIEAFEKGEKGEKDAIRGHRASDRPGPLFLEGELPDMRAIEEKNPDILKPIEGGKPIEKLFAVVHVDGETVKKAIEERFEP